VESPTSSRAIMAAMTATFSNGMKDPYGTGSKINLPTGYGVLRKSIAATSFGPKETRFEYMIPHQKLAPDSGRVHYLNSQNHVNYATFRKYGGQLGLHGINRISETSSAYGWVQPEKARGPSAELSRLYADLTAPVHLRAPTPNEAPIPSDYLPRSWEEHAPPSREATSQHHLRTRNSSKFMPRSHLNDSRPSTVHGPARSDVLFKSGPIWVNAGDGGRHQINVIYAGDEATAAEAAATAEKERQRPAEQIARALAAHRFTPQVPGHGYLATSADAHSEAAIDNLEERSKGLVAEQRKAAPDGLERPAHPRTHLFVWEKGAPVQKGEPKGMRRPATSAALSRPNMYQLESDEHTSKPWMRRTRMMPHRARGAAQAFGPEWATRDHRIASASSATGLVSLPGDEEEAAADAEDLSMSRTRERAWDEAEEPAEDQVQD